MKKNTKQRPKKRPKKGTKKNTKQNTKKAMCTELDSWSPIEIRRSLLESIEFGKRAAKLDPRTNQTKFLRFSLLKAYMTEKGEDTPFMGIDYYVNDGEERLLWSWAKNTEGDWTVESVPINAIEVFSVSLCHVRKSFMAADTLKEQTWKWPMLNPTDGHVGFITRTHGLDKM